MDEPLLVYDAPDWLKLAEAARYLHRSRRTLYEWHRLRVGPRAYKVGYNVLYRKADLDAWLDSGGDLDPWPPEWGHGARRRSAKTKTNGTSHTTSRRPKAPGVENRRRAS